MIQSTDVSIHAPARGATVVHVPGQGLVVVSIHAPARGATFLPRSAYSTPSGFNPRTRTGCDSAARCSRWFAASFNPRTRTGCDLIPFALCRDNNFVSIHAPARGATRVVVGLRVHVLVSIHAPARGATSQSPTRSRLRCCFNPRTRTGCDSALPFCPLPMLCFNPRTRTGCDVLRYSLSATSYGFNPRTRTGCDPVLGDEIQALDGVSIHAPARGATRSRFVSTLAPEFQSTHPHGVRPTPCPHRSSTRRFNPRTRTGCDVRCTSYHSVPSLFQSTHPHGVRLTQPT